VNSRASRRTVASRAWRGRLASEPYPEIGPDEPHRQFEAVESATLEWIDGFNNRRPPDPIGDTPPAEAEQRSYATMDDVPIAA
jgi:hypothetical protein